MAPFNENDEDVGQAPTGNELMNVPIWAWWTFGLSLLLVSFRLIYHLQVPIPQVLLFLLLDWLLIRRNALGSSPLCLSFRRHPSSKFGSSSGTGGMGGGGADWSQGTQGGGYAGGSLALSSGQSVFGHHKRSTNMILSV
jgi:uncharacterized membrane protein YgcG